MGSLLVAQRRSSCLDDNRIVDVLVALVALGGHDMLASLPPKPS
ncbi:MAG TPA: hypothetical protein VND23_07985 [Acidimicrobiales bacterium]|nr:hypothetical protein [Acidimicrobiales bacterium]